MRACVRAASSPLKWRPCARVRALVCRLAYAADLRPGAAHVTHFLMAPRAACVRPVCRVPSAPRHPAIPLPDCLDPRLHLWCPPSPPHTAAGDRFGEPMGRAPGSRANGQVTGCIVAMTHSLALPRSIEAATRLIICGVALEGRLAARPACRTALHSARIRNCVQVDPLQSSGWWRRVFQGASERRN